MSYASSFALTGPARGFSAPTQDVVQRIAEAGFVLLLLLIFVGLSPFDDRSAAAIAARNATTAAGDTVRQFSFLAVFAIIVFAAIRRRGVAAVKAIPVAFALLMVWCVASALWTDEPDVVVRRAILAAIFVASILLSVDTLGVTRTLVLWRNVMAVIIIADWASVLLVHRAIHLPDDMEAKLAGAWRGLHNHKNASGAIAATAAILFYHFARETRRRTDILLCAASIGFMIMTRSKSSMGLVPLALLAGLLYQTVRRSVLDRAIAATAAVLVLFLLLSGIVAEWDAIVHAFQNPQYFSGRVAIWQAELAYIYDHPLIGAGFGTFGNTGTRSPLYNYAGGWIAQIGQGHSGYLETLVTIGGIGFAIGVFAVIVQPLIKFTHLPRNSLAFNTMLFSLFAFDVLHNFMESDFITVTAVQWGHLLLVIALLGKALRERSADVQLAPTPSSLAGSRSIQPKSGT